MKLRLVSFRGATTTWADLASAEYGKRLQHYFPFEEKTFKAASAVEDAARLRRELGPRARLVVLDERGEDLDSPGLARWLEAAAATGAAELVFVIGGPYGHDPVLRGEAWRCLRLSAMVLNHAVARVVLIEQLYRACTIRAGEPYHH